MFHLVVAGPYLVTTANIWVMSYYSTLGENPAVQERRK